MSLHVGHLAFFSLAADLSAVHIKMFTTIKICKIKVFDIFKETSIGSHVRKKMLQCVYKSKFNSRKSKGRILPHHSKIG